MYPQPDFIHQKIAIAKPKRQNKLVAIDTTKIEAQAKNNVYPDILYIYVR